MKRKGAVRTWSSSSSQDDNKPEEKTEFGDLSIDKEDNGDSDSSKEINPDTLDKLKQMEQDIQKAGLGALGAGAFSPPPARYAAQNTGSILKQ